MSPVPYFTYFLFHPIMCCELHFCSILSHVPSCHTWSISILFLLSFVLSCHVCPKDIACSVRCSIIARPTPPPPFLTLRRCERQFPFSHFRKNLNENCLGIVAKIKIRNNNDNYTAKNFVIMFWTLSRDWANVVFDKKAKKKSRICRSWIIYVKNQDIKICQIFYEN